MKWHGDGSVAVAAEAARRDPAAEGRQIRHELRTRPSLARLRREGGLWKLYFFTSDSKWARALITEMDSTRRSRCIRLPPTVAGATGRRPYRAPSHSNTAMMFGDGRQSCFACHGQRTGAERRREARNASSQRRRGGDAGALRRAMAQPRLGGMMDRVLADPALNRRTAGAIRRCWSPLRDGWASRRATASSSTTCAPDRDPPARIAQLRTEGGWRLPRDAGCRVGTRLVAAQLPRSG